MVDFSPSLPKSLDDSAVAFDCVSCSSHSILAECLSIVRANFVFDFGLSVAVMCWEVIVLIVRLSRVVRQVAVELLTRIPKIREKEHRAQS